MLNISRSFLLVLVKLYFKFQGYNLQAWQAELRLLFYCLTELDFKSE